jgi:hypothetical protein
MLTEKKIESSFPIRHEYSEQWEPGWKSQTFLLSL